MAAARTRVPALCLPAEPQTDTEALLSRRIGCDVKCEWASSPRQYLKFTRSYRLPIRKPPEPIVIEADLHSDTLLASETEQETVARIAVSGLVKQLTKSSRIPLNLICVLDHSESMSGEKLQRAKEAAGMILNTIQPGDRCTVIGFSADSRVLVPTFDKGSGKVQTKALQGLEAAGGTNMSNAIRMAATLAKKAFAGNRVNRVLLLTDGHPTKRDGLLETVGELAKLNIYTTALGVGTDFNEDLLSNIADLGRGAYYFIEDSQQMGDMVKKELAALQDIVAKDVNVHLRPRDRVTIEGVTGFEFDRLPRNEVMIRIGDMSSSDKKIVLLNVAYCLSAGRHDLMDVTVSYMDAATEKKQQTSVLTANFVKELQDAQVAAPVAVVVDKINRVRSAGLLREAEIHFSTENVSVGQALLRTQSKELLRTPTRLNQAIAQELTTLAESAPKTPPALLRKRAKQLARRLEKE